jgi:hypothetical protein
MSPWEPEPCPLLQVEIGNREAAFDSAAKLRAEVERQSAALQKIADAATTPIAIAREALKR